MTPDAPALAQRARLLEAVCDDASRGGSVLRHMILPLRLPPLPVRAGALRGYAVDLARAPDGVWRVARDHVGGHPAAAVLEAPVLPAFLPGLCRALLGQSLLLASLPAWWLGDGATLALLRADTRRYSLRRSLDPQAPSVSLADPSPATRQRLQVAVAASPHDYVATLDLRLPVCRLDLGGTLRP